MAAGVTEALGQVVVPAPPVSWLETPGGLEQPKRPIAIWSQTPGATYYEIHGFYSEIHGTYGGHGAGQEAEVSAPQGNHQFGIRQDLSQLLIGDFDEIITFRIRACNKTGCSLFTEPIGDWPGLESSVFMGGLCQPGMKVNPGEGCYWDDGDSVFYVSSKRDGFIGEHLGCISQKGGRNGGLDCEMTLMGWDTDSDLYAAPTKLGEWFIRSKIDGTDPSNRAEPEQQGPNKATSKPATTTQATPLPLGDPELFGAIWRGQVDKVKDLITGGADVNVRDEDGAPFLYEAIWRGQLDVVKVLVAAGADVNARTRNGRSLLNVANRERNSEIWDLLVHAGATDTELPERPVTLTAKAGGGTEINLLWGSPRSDGGTDIIGYRIEVSVDCTAWSALEANTGSISNEYTHTGLAEGSTRFYRVFAINSVGTGPPTVCTAATTPLPPGNSAWRQAIQVGDTEAVEQLIADGNAVNVRGCVRSLEHVLYSVHEQESIPQRSDGRTVGGPRSAAPTSQARRPAPHSGVARGDERHPVRSAQWMHLASHAP